MNKQEALDMLYRNRCEAIGSYELENNYIVLGSDNELLDRNDNYIDPDTLSEFDDYFDATEMAMARDYDYCSPDYYGDGYYN